MEIDKCKEGADIVRLIKAQRTKWLGHIQRMDQTRPTKKLLDWKPMRTRPVGRPRQRWQQDIIPYPTAFPYGNSMVLHFYQQQDSSTTKTVHKVINKGLKTYV